MTQVFAQESIVGRGVRGQPLDVTLRLPALPLLTGAALLSNIGGVVQTTALSFWLARSTGSASALGLLAFSTIAPTLITTPLGGWLADHARRTTILLIGVTLQALTALVLSRLVAAEVDGLWPYCVVSGFSGAVLALGVSSWHSLLVDAAGSDTRAAVSANSVQFNVARTVGPWLAGLVLLTGRTELAMVGNAFSFLPVLAALAVIRRGPIEAASSAHVPRPAGGLRAALSTPTVRSVVVGTACLGLMAGPVPAFLPLLTGTSADDGWRLAVVTSAFGLGAAAGALGYARIARTRPLGLVVERGLLLLAFGLALLALGPLALKVVAGGLVGGAFAATSSALMTAAQSAAPPGMRGRVTSAYLLSLGASVPVAAVVQGRLADAWSLPAVMLCSAVGLVVLAAGWASRLRSGVLETPDLSAVAPQAAAT